MKETRKKVAKVCKTVFGYGIMIVLFAGGLTFFGYMAALLIGGEAAAAICAFIDDGIIPVIIYASTILILFGIATMYIAGEKALTPDKKQAKHEGER